MSGRSYWGILPAMLLIHCAAFAADGHEHHQHQPASNAVATDNVSHIQAPDLELRDQNNRVVRFSSDIVGDDIVVMDFAYTTCTTVCPVLTTILGQVQKEMGDRLGKGVTLVTLTVDPVRDTPQRLASYAQKHKAGEHWRWLTGDKSQVDQVLTAFGAYSANFADHPSLVMVGDGRSGNWYRFFGFPDPKDIVGAVERLSIARAQTGHDHHHVSMGEH